MFYSNFSTCNKSGKKALIIIVLSSILLTCCDAFGQSNKEETSTKVLRSLGRIYVAYGEYAKAQPLFEKALKRAKEKDVPDSEMAMCLIDMAYLYNKQNKLDDAEEICLKGLILQQKSLCDNHPYVAGTLRLLSTIYRRQARFTEAMEALERASDIMLQVYNEQDFPMAGLKVDVAKLLFSQGKLEQAEIQYYDALEIIEINYGLEHLFAAIVMEDLGQLHLQQKRYSEAESLIDHALSLKEKVYGWNSQSLISTLLIKAEIEKHKDNYGKLEEYIGRASDIVYKTDNITKIAKFQQRVEIMRSPKVAPEKVFAKAFE